MRWNKFLAGAHAVLNLADKLARRVNELAEINLCYWAVINSTRTKHSSQIPNVLDSASRLGQTMNKYKPSMCCEIFKLVRCSTDQALKFAYFEDFFTYK